MSNSKPTIHLALVDDWELSGKSGIDTGERIVHSEQVDVSNFDSAGEAKRFLFDLDREFFRKALELLQSETPVYTTNDGSGRRYYVMSKLFLEVVEDPLKRQN